MGAPVFLSTLLGVYVMYEPEWPIPAERMHAVTDEAQQFVAMMYQLWDEEADGSLTAAQFDRAAHQHPLLVQAGALPLYPMPTAGWRTRWGGNPLLSSRGREATSELDVPRRGRG